MPAKILSGNIVRDERLIELIKQFEKITPAPELVIIQVGDRPDSTTYINAKISFAKKVGVIAHHIHLSESASQEEVIREIKKCNENEQIKGIIVQLPVPEHINRDEVINSIDPRKDIDGQTAFSMQCLSEGRPDAIVPATARGIRELLSYYNIDIKSKKITVVGRSALVGTPVAQVFARDGAVVTVAHSKTIDLIKETNAADIIVVAIGKPRLISAQHVRLGQIIVDVGITREGEVGLDNKAKLVGDVDFEAVSQIIGPSGAITPVPGGVGPMTVLGLFENLLDVSRD
ncbi:MAG TPA: bifunctional 5,10-methylenetetrahydrofolate dehydrogenase/5,10-methenyltetrahydrofolate cyclohydrolase [Candidatus Paceibacterota bacterium]|jgi:methylenetetrahydrofolate dehydrogenase (NADP+)/methenyltetrahydrofolate cyclohydrolase|nr:bifunctional 5,10-methylenetetrahydrofolate dehydrogenase/5,10-methenyltetrahydrofolate cyclohydrolase [Candidatus Paceibacterota bacterium]